MHPYYRYRTAPRRIPIRGRNNTILSTQADAAVQDEVLNSKTVSADTETIDEPVEAPAAAGPDWQSTALELRAEMDNFRKRQARRADEAAAAEQERLLRLILPVADNLARALNHDDQANVALRQGVELTYRELMRSLEAEGVTRLETIGQPFDPNLHEAIATRAAEAATNMVVEEIEAGYRLGDKLLRPARVVVAM
jgi:molecular chaperone GrpE